MRVFISYQRKDEALAAELRAQLHTWGFNVWMDIYDIPKGAYWTDEIEKGLRESDIVVGLMSTNALLSRNVKNEWDWTIVNGQHFSTNLILLRLDACVVPMNYVGINYIDFTVSNRKSSFEALHTAISSHPKSQLHSDAYSAYLRSLFDDLEKKLQLILSPLASKNHDFPEPLVLKTERTVGAVDVATEKIERADPLLKSMGVSDEPKSSFKGLTDAIEEFEGELLVLGEAGIGKTTSLLFAARDAVVRRMLDPKAPLPIMMSIHTWKRGMQFEDWLAQAYIVPKNIGRIIRQGKALLLLDGLDELGSSAVDEVTKELYDPREAFMAVLPANNFIVITCRKDDYYSIAQKIPLKGAVTLQPLDLPQIRFCLHDQPELLAWIGTDPGLFDLLKIPLLLRFFAFAFNQMSLEERARFKDLEANANDLRDNVFAVYIEKRFEYETLKPNNRITCTFDELLNFAGYLAMGNVKSQNIITVNNFDDRSNTMIDYLLQLGILIQSGKYPSFIHLLLRDSLGYQFAVANVRNIELNSADFSSRPGLALGDIGDRRAVPILMSVLNDINEDESVRYWAAVGLGALKDETAIECLLLALIDLNSRVQLGAVRALTFFPHPRALKALTYAVLDRTLYPDGAMWTPANALRHYSDKQATKALLAGATNVGRLDEDYEIRRECVVALGDKRHRSGVRPLLKLLQRAKSDYRWEVTDIIHTLGEMKDKRATQALLEELNSADIDVVAHSAEALATIGISEASSAILSRLIEMIEVRNNTRISLKFYDDSLITIAKALGELKEKRAGVAFCRLLSLDNNEMKYAILETIIRTKSNQTVECIVNELSNEYRASPYRPRICDLALAALEAVGTSEALSAIAKWKNMNTS